MQTSSLKTLNHVPHINATDKVILFDGVCHLCNGWSRFIIRYDTKHVFKLAPLQSSEGADILSHFGLPTDNFDSMVYVEENVAYMRSDAALKIVRHLPAPFHWFSLLSVVPKWLRDWVYDRIALNRYTIFGRYDTCVIPTPDHDQRFLGKT